MFQIALDYDKGVDIPCTKPRRQAWQPSIIWLKRWENAATEGQADHQPRLCAGNANEQQVDKLAHRMVAQQISIARRCRLARCICRSNSYTTKAKSDDRHRQRYRPLVTLRPGRMLEKANLYAQLYIRPNEQNYPARCF